MRRSGLRIGAMAVAILASAAAARAQDGQVVKPPPEIGIGWGRLTPIRFDFITDDMTEPSVELRATVPVTPRFSVEGLVTVGRRKAGFVERTEGLYLVQVKQRLPRTERGRLHPFLTYGLTGYYGHVVRPETIITNPDGSTDTLPARTFNEVDEVLSMVVGAGLQYEISRHLAVRGDVQFLSVLWIPVGVRYSAGISIPLGSYRD
jgi:hypothetical protein